MWANGDEFWGTNILSPEKFRKQYDQLYAKMLLEKNKTGAGEWVNINKLSDEGLVRMAKKKGIGTHGLTRDQLVQNLERVK